MSGVTHRGRRGLVREDGRVRFRACREVRKLGRRALICECVEGGSEGGRCKREERGWEGRRVRLRIVHQIGRVVERASGIPMVLLVVYVYVIYRGERTFAATG